MMKVYELIFLKSKNMLVSKADSFFIKRGRLFRGNKVGKHFLSHFLFGFHSILMPEACLSLSSYQSSFLKTRSWTGNYFFMQWVKFSIRNIAFLKWIIQKRVSRITITIFQKKILENSIKKFSDNFLKPSYPSNYGPEKGPYPKKV